MPRMVLAIKIMFLKTVDKALSKLLLNLLFNN